MNELFTLVESHETAARVGIASGSTVFDAAVRELAVTKRVLAHSFKNEDAQRSIVSRIGDLVEQSIDLRYRHPHDIPLAIYLWLLRRLNMDLSRLAAHVVLQTRNCAWAHRMALGIHDATEHNTGATSLVVHSNEPRVATTGEVRIVTANLNTLRSRAHGSWAVAYPTSPARTHLETSPSIAGKIGVKVTRASIAA